MGFVLGLLADGLLRLDAQDLVLEHLARAVGVNPRRGVVEDARRVAVHVVPGLLPLLELADDLLAVLAVRLEIGRPLQEIDRAAQLVHLGADLEPVRERPAERRVSPLAYARSAIRKRAVGVERVLPERL